MTADRFRAGRFRAGVMRHRITIQQDVSSEGDESPDFSGVHDQARACMVHDIGGGKTFRGQQVEAHITTIVEMRWDKGLSNRRHRFKFGERFLNIDKIIDVDGRMRYAEVHCEEVAD